MSIIHCDRHGRWDSDESEVCPLCADSMINCKSDLTDDYRNLEIELQELKERSGLGFATMQCPNCKLVINQEYNDTIIELRKQLFKYEKET